MSVGYNPKDSLVMDQSLKVQELVISGSDQGMYVISGGSTFVMVREPVDKIYRASVKVDSSNLVTQFQKVNLVICDSVLLTAGGNQGAMKLVGLSALAANDVIIIHYSVLEHL